MNNTMFITEGITQSERFLRTPGDFALNNLNYVQEIGCLKSVRSHRCIRENLESYLIFIVAVGSGMIRIGEEEQSLVMGDCVFVDCRQHYEHQSSSGDPWELMWVHCNGQHMKAFHDLFVMKNHGKEYITVEDTDKIKRYFGNLVQLQRDQDILVELKSSVLIEQILESLIEEAVRQENKKLYVVYNQVREYINENYRKHALVEWMANMFKLSAEELDEGFQKVYGIDIYDYILNRRFTKAKELLRFTIMPVSDVVEASGICNDDLFRKMFKEHEKMTAEEYRKKWAQWVK